jgi:hypothetical protein
MGHANPFYTFKFQKISNDIRNFSIHWVLTPTIALWKFKSPLGLQHPKWKLPWECEGSFLQTFLHFQEHEVWLPCFLLGPQPCKPKVRVTTSSLIWTWIQQASFHNFSIYVPTLLWVISQGPLFMFLALVGFWFWLSLLEAFEQLQWDKFYIN